LNATRGLPPPTTSAFAALWLPAPAMCCCSTTTPRLEPDAIALLTAAAAADQRLGIVGPAIVSWQNPAIVYLGGRIDWRSGDGLEVLATPETLTQPRGGCGICAGLCAADQGCCHPPDRAAGGKLFRLLRRCGLVSAHARAGFAVCSCPPRRGFFTKTRLTYTARKPCGRSTTPGATRCCSCAAIWPRAAGAPFRVSLARRLKEYTDLLDRGATGRAHSLVAGVWDGLRGVTGEQPGTAPPLVIWLFGLAAQLQQARLRLRSVINQHKRGARQQVRRVLRPCGGAPDTVAAPAVAAAARRDRHRLSGFRLRHGRGRSRHSPRAAGSRPAHTLH
jgi:hypothetical protein